MQTSLLPTITLEQRLRAVFGRKVAAAWIVRKLERIAIGLDCAFCFQLMPMNRPGTGAARGCEFCQMFGPPPAWWPDATQKKRRRKSTEVAHG